MTDLFDLERFVTAQQPVIEDVMAELKAGRKTTHWMWFVFPQVRGLGFSPMSKRYAISSLVEAKAYLAHPLLGQRLVACTRLVLATEGRDVHQIFGGPDDLKFRSCMTLFAAADPSEPVFQQALDRFFQGSRDKKTLEQLGPR